MRVLTHVFAGAGTVDYLIPGKYLRVIQTTAAIDIVPLDGMREIESEKGFGIEAGYATRPPGGFDGIRITSSGAQTVRFAISNGAGDYNRLSGDVNILSSSVTLPVSIAGTVNVAQRNSFTSSAASITAQGANSFTALIAPATNVNGILIVSLMLSAVSASGNLTGKHSFIAKASAPTTGIDGDVVLIGENADGPVTGSIKAPILLTAGKGLYYFTDNAEQICYRSVLFIAL